MGDWLKRRWKSIEGRVLWVPLAMLGSFFTSFLPIESLRLWLHQPVSNIWAWLWSCFPVIAVTAIFVITRDRTLPLKIEVKPTSGPNPEIFLSVTNLGKLTTLSAFCEIVAHPNGVNDYRRGEVRVGWHGGVERQTLLQGETANLLVASFEEVVKFDLSQLNLWQVVNGKPERWDSFRWNQHPDEILPGFDLKIRILGENTKSPQTFYFTVKPYRFLGPLEMVPTEVAA